MTRKQELFEAFVRGRQKVDNFGGPSSCARVQGLLACNYHKPLHVFNELVANYFFNPNITEEEPGFSAMRKVLSGHSSRKDAQLIADYLKNHRPGKYAMWTALQNIMHRDSKAKS